MDNLSVLYPKRGSATITPVTRYCWRCAAPLDAPPPTTCSSCGEPHYNNPKPAAEAVVVHDGNVLLLKRAIDPYRDHWDIPGGFCEPGEHPARAAERELLEETGHHARSTELLGIWMDVYGDPEPDGLQATTMNVSYLLELTEGEAIIASDGEATELKWFPLDGPPAELAFPEHAHDVLRAAVERLSRR